MTSLRFSGFRLPRWCSLALVLLAPALVHAQPSGGPYGPQPQTYTVPSDAPHVYYVAPDGRADAPGRSLDAPTTLESAIRRAATGDAIILRGGTYRTGSLVTNQGIILQPHADERPVLKGTRVATEWEALRGNVWRTRWTTLFPQKPADWWRRHREGMRTPLHRFNNDMVFVDGRALQSANWEGELDENAHYIDYEGGWVYLGTDPTNCLVEITAHDGAITRTTADVHDKKSDRKGFVLRGLTFTQYAYRALEVEGREPEGLEDESKFGHDAVGTTLEHVTITHCSRVAAYLRGNRTTIRHCYVSDTSTEGIYLIASSDCLLEKNIFARNNVEQITGYYPSAVKIFNQTHRVVCRDNLVLDQPYSNGIWYDVGNRDGVFINNWIQDCLDGFFFEISRGAICAGNVFVNCDKGVRSLNAADVHVYHNTFVNTVVAFERTERSAVADHFGWHPATGPDVDERDGHIVVGNLIAGDASFRKAMLLFGQTQPLQGELHEPQATRVEGNVY
ncbi:MAG TPA: right-handed parallel beta-helix repeat-containing protein, partial [Candidatus Synoicihabitans sp.]|nr:right-handed parallel beta-helix repeat-containing protein [Candidatus Synoicihabitans sp.]